MKIFALFLVIAVAFEAALGQCLRSNVIAAPAAEVLYSPAVTPAVIQSNSVAVNLADTLSLLTVSSLLAEKLPLGYPAVVASVPSVGACGCGYGPYGYIL